MNSSMRDAFLDELYEIARNDSRVILISNDFGAPSLDKYREDLAPQFIHIGIAEQNMVNVATGLALAGKKVYIYSLAPFLPLRCYEQLRVHLGFKGYDITAVMVGTGFSYELSGPSHQSLEDIAVMNALPGVTIYSPSDSDMGKSIARMTYDNPGAKYIRFDREKLPVLSRPAATSYGDGLTLLEEGKDVTIVSTSVMVHQSFKVREALAGEGIDAGIVDLYRLKPINEELLMRIAEGTGRLVSIEESFVNSGIGNLIAPVITNRESNVRLKMLGVPNRYIEQAGSREGLRRLCGLDVPSLTETIRNWVKGS